MCQAKKARVWDIFNRIDHFRGQTLSILVSLLPSKVGWGASEKKVPTIRYGLPRHRPRCGHGVEVAQGSHRLQECQPWSFVPFDPSFFF